MLRLRRSLPFLFPPAGVAIAVVFRTVPETMLLAGAYVAAHAVTIPDRAGRRLSLSPMVTVAALLLVDHSVHVVVAGAALGMPIGWWMVRILKGVRSLDHLFPAEALALVVAIGTYSGIHGAIIREGGPADLEHAVIIGITSLAWYVTASVARLTLSGRRRRVAARLLLWEALRDGPAYAALFSGGAMFGFAWQSMSWWAFPVAALPYAFSHLSLQRVATTRRTYRETIVALGRIPEAGGLVGHGRAERTAALASAMAAELRLSPPEVERVEFAGLLHDVGKVVYNDPAVAEAGYSESDVAAWGAAIIQESPYLARVGQLVAEQAKPYRRPGEARNELVPQAAQVLRVAATYDRSVSEQGLTVVEALEGLHRGAAYEYDPEVVAALRRVLQRRGVPGA